MPLTQQQISELKAQLKSQTSHLEPQQKAEAEKQIDAMSPEALETMLKQQQETQVPVYRKIISKEIPSVQVGENPDAIAVLDNKPISKGHAVIIPKIQVKTPNQIPASAFSLAQELTDKIVKNLKAKSAKAHTETKFGESIINLIPTYDKELDLSSPRTEATPEQLNEIKSSLEVIQLKKTPEIIKIKKPRGRKPKLLKLKRRIP